MAPPIKETCRPGEFKREDLRRRAFLLGRTPATGEKVARAFRAKFESAQPLNQADSWEPSRRSNTRKH
jgi:hypothetical protein